jgi:HEAT repeat protein
MRPDEGSLHRVQYLTGFRALVDEKLRTTAGDWRLRGLIPRQVLDREAYEAAVLAHFGVTREWLARTDLVAASPLGVQVLGALASHNAGYIDSARWRAYLDARTPDAWLAIAEQAGPLEASATAAAATWLDSSVRARADVIRRRHGGLVADEPIVKSPTHWMAWHWGKQVSGVHIPSLLAHDHIESLSIRTRIYRSLGQVPHQASAVALREALDDPHPFARAQAARSLGWLGDPLAVERLGSLVEDKDSDVRRTSKLAIERIVGYWTLFGQWHATIHDIDRRAAAIEQLADLGLRAFASELIHSMPNELAVPLHRKLDRHSLNAKRPRHYAAYFAEDATEAAAIAATDPRTEGPSMRRLFAITAQRAVDELPYAERLVRAREPVGWNARRVFRAFGVGAPSQRCREA